jgi:hypothetical protein
MYQRKNNKAIELAQHTPSACNRQGWKTMLYGIKTLFRSSKVSEWDRGFGDGIINCYSSFPTLDFSIVIESCFRHSLMGNVCTEHN